MDGRDALIAALRDEDPSIRLRAIAWPFPKHASELETDAFRQELPRLLADPHPIVRLQAVKRIPVKDVRSHSGILVGLLDYYFTPAAAHAAQLLGQLRDPSLVPTFLDAISHKNRRRTLLRAELAMALARTGDPRAFEKLAHLASAATNREVKVTATRALGILGDARAEPVLKELLTHQGYEIELLRRVRTINPVRDEAAKSLRLLSHRNQRLCPGPDTD